MTAVNIFNIDSIDELQCIPFRMNENADKFADFEDVLPWEISIHGHTLTTSALKPNVALDIMALNTTHELLMAGIQDHSDSLDTRASIEGVYVRIASGISTLGKPRVDYVELSTNRFVKYKEGPSCKLITDSKHTVILPDNKKISFNMVGLLNTQTATLEVRFENITWDNAEADTSYTVTVVGYVPKIYRVNLNRRRYVSNKSSR